MSEGDYVRPEDVGHWEGDTFVLDQPVTLPNGRTVRRVTVPSDASISQDMTRDDVIHVILNAVTTASLRDRDGDDDEEVERRERKLEFARLVSREAEVSLKTAEHPERGRCLEGHAVFYLPGGEALIPGHVYSEAGLREFRISGYCEWCFDRFTREVDPDVLDHLPDDDDEDDVDDVDEEDVP